MIDFNEKQIQNRLKGHANVLHIETWNKKSVHLNFSFYFCDMKNYYLKIQVKPVKKNRNELKKILNKRASAAHSNSSQETQKNTCIITWNHMLLNQNMFSLWLNFFFKKKRWNFETIFRNKKGSKLEVA